MFYYRCVVGVNDSLTEILILVPRGEAPHPRIFAIQHRSAAHTGKS